MDDRKIEAGRLPERVRAFYERVNEEREGALVELPELYADDLIFANPVLEEQGLDRFESFWHEAFGKYKLFQFDGLTLAAESEDFFTMVYTMRVAFCVGPTFKVISATDFYARDGKVIRTRDYFDPLGTLVGPFPILNWLYRKIFRVLVA
ncbi:MAG: nuclear transport factor 2 family protein [Sandaracinaceae bacterium]|nr:nuclear transport factor 2 family protein [Sandaracinaceae bacterium]